MNQASKLNQRLFRLARLLAGAALLCGPVAAHAATSTWNGGSTSDSNWSDAANWGGTALASGNAVTFAGTAKTLNTNDVAGLSLAAVTLSTAGWNISGNPVTLTSTTFAATASGTSTWGLNSTLNVTPSFTGGAAADLLNITGYLSGTGGISRTAGSTGQGALYLSNTTNSFTGAVNVNSGTLYFYTLALGGQASSLGSGTGAIGVGNSGTSYAASLVYLGTTNGITDRALHFANNTVTTITVSNNSPNNASLSFVPAVANPFTFTDANAADVFQLTLSGTSTGTNLFTAQFGSSLWGGNLLIGGPGTFVFSNVFNLTNTLTVATNSHVVLLYNAAIGLPNSEFPALGTFIFNPGATLDVSSYDTNDMDFELGSATLNGVNFPQSLTIGRTNGAATDINGSLSLNGPYGATLVVAGANRAGSLTISSNFIAGSGTIKMDLGTNVTTGSGSNDIIYVGGNLDLSQGTAIVSPSLLKGALNTNAAYTLISYAGSLIGGASGLSVPAPGRVYSPGVVSTATPGLVQVTFGPSGATNANLFWRGNDGPNWDLDTTPNWLNNGSGDYFYAGDTVVFNDSASQFAVNMVGSLSPSTVTVSNNINNYTLGSTSGGTLGNGALLKQGGGELTLNTINTYSGGTVISAGTIVATNTTPLGGGTVTLGDSNTGTNNVTLAFGVGALMANTVNISSNAPGIITLTYAGGVGTLNGPINLAGPLTFNTATNSNVNNFLIQGGITGTGDVTIVGNGGVKWQTGVCTFAGNIFVTGTNTLFDCNSALATNNLYLGPGAWFGDVSDPKLNVLSGSGCLEAGVGATYVPSLYIGAGNGSGTFSGQITNNPGGYGLYINKMGTGTEIFTGDNSLSGGGITVGSGTLAIDNTNGYGLPLGGFTVIAGATLCGNGSVASLTNSFQVNGVLQVGNPGDTSGATFVFTNGAGLFINSGGSLNVSLFSGAGAGDNTGVAAAADTLVALCPVSLATNTTLNVANPNNLTAWKIGDKWKIASWLSTPTNTFATLNLPALGSGLAWDTSSLYTSGVIAVIANVVPTSPASILGVTVAGGNLIINGTNLNGGQNFHYAVLTSTNLAIPLANWTSLSTNSFNVNGTFNYTNPINPAAPQLYFDVKAVQ